MMPRSIVLMATIAAATAVAAQSPTPKAEATSLFGKPLYAITLPNRDKLEADLRRRGLAVEPVP